ncbi:hypothetical protein O3P69_013559 [Scylla paramamosain]|uniref:Uncharacterized protein n=1 Tax=Scylla paramamosain TaxID=85552 RepID=A0AAW0SBQ7_SCYPA
MKLAHHLSSQQVGGSDGGGGGSGGEVDGRDRGAVQAADIKEKRNARTSKVLFGSLILDLLGLKVVLPVSSALLDCYSKHNTSGLYSSQLSCESLPEGRRRRDIGASLTEAWEVINPRALFSVSCVKGLGREGTHLHCDAAPWVESWLPQGSGNTRERGSQRLRLGLGVVRNLVSAVHYVHRKSISVHEET